MKDPGTALINIEKECLYEQTVVKCDWKKMGALLKGYRLSLDISLREMARQLNVSASYICDVEYGRRTITREMRRRYLVVVAQAELGRRE